MATGGTAATTSTGSYCSCWLQPYFAQFPVRSPRRSFTAQRRGRRGRRRCSAPIRIGCRSTLRFCWQLCRAPQSTVDGDSRRNYRHGDDRCMIATAAISPDHSRIFTGDTFFSRGVRGGPDRRHHSYDTGSLEPVSEVKIPPKRQLAGPDNLQLGATSDGHLLLVANMTPATSVTVIDIAASKVLGEIPITGCAEFQLTGNRQFASLCGDGSLLMVNFDDSGQVDGRKAQSGFLRAREGSGSCGAGDYQER